jgi:hypothetical protein
MKYADIREEELKNRVAQDYFWLYDCAKIIGNVDFCVCLHRNQKSIEQESLLWAEAKRGAADIYKSLVQLILTIGKARTFDHHLPPAMLGAFDGEKMAFIPYNDIHEVFYQNDFNWNVAPSNHDTKEFQLIYDRVKNSIDSKALLFNYEKDDCELKRFIKNNFADAKLGLTKIKIDKNNFISIYNKWLETVKPSIAVKWEFAQKYNLIDGDFYLADLLSIHNETIRENLFVLLKTSYYETNRQLNEDGMFSSSKADFSDRQKAHTQFWNKYERPPKEEYWDYIIARRDLLVPQDVRERKGSFFTPTVWVELSQKYIADVLGEDWQDEHYVWDCCAGTGNLLAGLTNKYHIWASTLDKADVDVMHQRIVNGANLLESHVFRFDFLNDDFSKLPQGLQDIINDPKKRKKLVVYINPPYAEDTTKKTITGTGKNKISVAQNKIHDKYATLLKKANHELFAQFLMRIYCEIPTAKIANFSKLKNLQSSNFSDFRKVFQAKLEKIFLMQANTFDNVTGLFPIGFFVWDSEKRAIFEQISADVYDKSGNFRQQKTLFSVDDNQTINQWLKTFEDKKNETIGLMVSCSPDFQHNNQVAILSKQQARYCFAVTKNNLPEMSIYFAVRKVIPATWLNDRDQFLYPNDGWKADLDFQNDCLAYTLFNNNIRATPIMADLTRKKRDSGFRQKEIITANHWIPFTEYQVGAQDKFASNFMSDFMAGKTKQPDIVAEPMLFYDHADDSGGSVAYRKPAKRLFSAEAESVFKAGLKLWRHYHSQSNIDVNASLYDIKEYFQGRDEKGKMKSRSEDEKYNQLIGNLRENLNILAKRIEPKIYKYGFLKE